MNDVKKAKQVLEKVVMPLLVFDPSVKGGLGRGYLKRVEQEMNFETATGEIRRG